MSATRPTPWRLRAATPADADAIAGLLARSTRRHIAPMCSADGAARLLDSMSADSVRERLQAGIVHRVAETREGALVGVAAMRPPAHLQHLFVDEAWQRRGVARALWAAVRADFFARRSAGPVTVNAARGAQAAYARLGFVADGPERIEHGVPSAPMRWSPPDAGR